MSKFIKLISNPKILIKKIIRKIIKLIKSPILFFKAYSEIKNINNEKQIFAFRINDWKRPILENWLFPEKLVFIPFKITKKNFYNNIAPKILANKDNSLLIWGKKIEPFIERWAVENSVTINWVEDGFIRSIGLGADHTTPLSLNFDSKGLYFDSTKESDLEVILNTYDFDNDKELMARALKFKKILLEHNISKYNNVEDNKNIKDLYGEKNKKRVLVIGQVEDDASIIYGCSKIITNNDLVNIAYLENPDAQIIYKPHPDVLFQKRKNLSNPADVKHLALILEEPLSLAQSFETIDHVYTITSQAGFEALLRGIEVTTLGSPFYSNWGITNDKEIIARRNKKLTVDQVLAGAYLLYPQYFHPYLKKRISPEEALDLLILLKNKAYLEDETLIDAEEENLLSDIVLKHQELEVLLKKIEERVISTDDLLNYQVKYKLSNNLTVNMSNEDGKLINTFIKDMT